MRHHTVGLALSAFILLALVAAAQASPASSAGRLPREVKVALQSAAQAPSLAPMAAGRASSSHAPFNMGECRACHRSNDQARPGPVTRAPAALCLDCHDQLDQVPDHGGASTRACTTCHNPHNAPWKALLR